MTLREVWGNDINIFLGDFNCEEYWSTPDELQDVYKRQLESRERLWKNHCEQELLILFYI